MNVWKRFALLAMSIFLIALLAACEAKPPTGSAGSASPTAAPTSVPPTVTPQATGGCTTETSCDHALVTVTPHQVKRGGKVTLTVKGWVANVNVLVYAGGASLSSDEVTTRSDAQGNFSATLTILSNAPSGSSNINVAMADHNGDERTLGIFNQLTIIA